MIIMENSETSSPQLFFGSGSTLHSNFSNDSWTRKKILLIKKKILHGWLLAIILEKNSKFYVYIIDAYWIYNKFYQKKKIGLVTKGQFQQRIQPYLFDIVASILPRIR